MPTNPYAIRLVLEPACPARVDRQRDRLPWEPPPVPSEARQLLEELWSLYEEGCGRPQEVPA